MEGNVSVLITMIITQAATQEFSSPMNNEMQAGGQDENSHSRNMGRYKVLELELTKQGKTAGPGDKPNFRLQRTIQIPPEEETLELPSKSGQE